MTKTELISVVANKAGLPKAAAEKAINATIDAIQQALRKGDKVRLHVDREWCRALNPGEEA